MSDQDVRDVAAKYGGMNKDLDEDQLDFTQYCLCGRPARHTCGDIWPPVTLTLCPLPLCDTGCKVHRHAPGTMGYPGQMRGITQYEGDTPNGDGLWEWLKSRYRTFFWSDLRKAQETYAEVCANFAPPAPWPYLQLQIGRKVFESFGPDGVREMDRGAQLLRRSSIL